MNKEGRNLGCDNIYWSLYQCDCKEMHRRNEKYIG